MHYKMQILLRCLELGKSRNTVFYILSSSSFEMVPLVFLRLGTLEKQNYLFGSQPVDDVGKTVDTTLRGIFGTTAVP